MVGWWLIIGSCATFYCKYRGISDSIGEIPINQLVKRDDTGFWTLLSWVCQTLVLWYMDYGSQSSVYPVMDIITITLVSLSQYVSSNMEVSSNVAPSHPFIEKNSHGVSTDPSSDGHDETVDIWGLRLGDTPKMSWYYGKGSESAGFRVPVFRRTWRWNARVVAWIWHITLHWVVPPSCKLAYNPIPQILFSELNQLS